MRSCEIILLSGNYLRHIMTKLVGRLVPRTAVSYGLIALYCLVASKLGQMIPCLFPITKSRMKGVDMPRCFSQCI